MILQIAIGVPAAYGVFAFISKAALVRAKLSAEIAKLKAEEVGILASVEADKAKAKAFSQDILKYATGFAGELKAGVAAVEAKL